MSKATTFGQWLKQRRKVLGLTQKELAKQLGCAEVTLRKIEAGDFAPSAPLALSSLRPWAWPMPICADWFPGVCTDDDFTGKGALAPATVSE